MAYRMKMTPRGMAKGPLAPRTAMTNFWPGTALSLITTCVQVGQVSLGKTFF